MIRRMLVLVLSIAIALMLSMVPMPGISAWFRPTWAGLLVVFWCVYAPGSFGLFSAWLIGLLLDQVSGTLLGLHAFGFVLLAYLTSMVQNRFQIAPLFQQTVMLGVLLFLYQLWTIVILGMVGMLTEVTWIWWMTPLVSTLLWPMTLLFRRRVSLLFYEVNR